MYKLLFSAFLAMLSVACSGPRYVDYFPYNDNGRPKPKVTMVPVLDSSGSQVSWDLSQELSQSIYYQLMDSGELYVMSPEEVGPVWAKRDSIDFFNGDMSFTKEFCNSDFIVAMELIENSVKPVVEGVSCGKTIYHPCNKVLTMRMRLKVIDVRFGCPRVVLYEIVKAEYVVASTSEKIDFDQICWGANGYQMTPCGIVHQRIVCSVSKRLEETLWTIK